MTIMTTPATPPVKTAAAAEKPASDTSAKIVVSSPKVEPKVEPKIEPKIEAEERLTFNKEKYDGFKIVRMYLLNEGCIQYDPANPDLVLNTADKKGMLLPLTPFFKSRIGVTLEVVF